MMEMLPLVSRVLAMLLSSSSTQIPTMQLNGSMVILLRLPICIILGLERLSIYQNSPFYSTIKLLGTLV